MRIVDSDFRVGPGARFAGELEGEHARNIALHRQQLQIEHQSRVIGIHFGHTRRPVEIGQRVVFRVGLGALNAAFNFTHRGEVIVHLGAIGTPELPLQTADILGDKIE